MIWPFLIAILPFSLSLTRAVLGILLGVVKTSQEDSCSLVLFSLGRVVQASVVGPGKATAKGRVGDSMLVTIQWLRPDRYSRMDILRQQRTRTFELVVLRELKAVLSIARMLLQNPGSCLTSAHQR